MVCARRIILGGDSLEASLTTVATVILHAALQTKRMLPDGLHTDKLGSLWGDMTKETGSYMRLSSEVRKPQWKCPFLLSRQGKYWCELLARQHVLCAVHTVKNWSVKTSGKWQTRSSLALLKTLTIGRGRTGRIYLKEGGEKGRKHCNPEAWYQLRWKSGGSGGIFVHRANFVCCFM